MKAALGLGLLSAAGIAAILAAMFMNGDAFGFDLSGHLLIAFILGAVFTLAVSGGLMFLIFYSARRGYDEVDRPEDGPFT